MNTKAINNISYGLFVITTNLYKDNGCIINTAIQVTSDPNRISVAINKKNLTHDLVMESREFNISVISEEADFELFKRFGFQTGRSCGKFDDFKDYKYSSNGIAYITKGTNAYISAKVINSIDLGTHTLFIADVTDMDFISDIPSATYSYYHAHIKPNPQKNQTEKVGKTVWRCSICGYEHEGDELPENFVCPLCKHPASDFEKIEV